MFWKFVVFGFILLVILFAAALVKVAGYWSRVEEYQKYEEKDNED